MLPENLKQFEVPIKVLNHGFIRLIDTMGDDKAIVDMARVSYQAGTKKVSSDRTLLRYLMRMKHTSPFEGCVIKLHIKCPIFVAREWMRHRTCSFNEISARYSQLPEEFYIPAQDRWALQAQNNKQGSGDKISDELSSTATEKIKNIYNQAYDTYTELLNQNIARELARTILPVGIYTEFYVQQNLHNLLHFLSLRMDSHAQLEIRSYANIIGNEIVSKWVPHTWEAFTDYRLDAMYLTKYEAEMIEEYFRFGPSGVKQLAFDLGWLKREQDGLLKPNRERAEAEKKFRRFNMVLPWSTEYA